MANGFATNQQFTCDTSLSFEELFKTETLDSGMTPPNDMDMCEHAKSTSRRRSPMPSRGTSPRGPTTKNVDTIRTSDPQLNHIPVISFGGSNSGNDDDFQDWCGNRGDGNFTIPSEINKPRSKVRTDEDTVVTDGTYSMSQSSQSSGGFRCLLQRVDSIRIAASTRMEAKKTALEESLMQQLADMQSLHDAEINELGIKLHQREAAIKTLERALCLRSDAVEEVRDDLDKSQAKLMEAERTIRRLERQLATTKASNPPKQAVEEFSSRRTHARRRRSYSATPRLTGHSSEAHHRRNDMSLGALFDREQRIAKRRGRMGARQASQRSFDTDPLPRAFSRDRSRTRSCGGMSVL